VPSSPAVTKARPLREVIAAPDYFARVSEVVLRIESAPDAATVIELLHEATGRIGADVAAFLSFIPDGDCESFRFLLACDPRWCVDYEQRAWYADDPWLAYAKRHTEPVCASEIAVRGDSQSAVVKLAERYGFRSTAIIPAPSSTGLARLGMLCLGSDVPNYFEAEGFSALKVIARPLAAALHEWSTRSVRDELVRSSGITPSDLLLLQYEREGLGTKQIASALGVSTIAVNSRFQRINLKLGVLHRQAAARLAAECGLI
jgi:DNA-binding CsgD family transcriptional regulator